MTRLFPLLLVLSLQTGCFDSLVTLRCDSELNTCGGECVDSSSDPNNCGACGIVCENSCSEGVCVQPGGGDDVFPGIVRFPHPIDPDPIPVPTCDLGETLCEGTCRDTDRDPDHCGGCDSTCENEEFCTNGRCIPECDAPFILCGDQCIDPDSDQLHCGECSNTCNSGVCSAGDCQDLGAGHVVYIGHDYTASNGAMERALGNAAFAIGPSATIAAYMADSNAAQRSGVQNALANEASARGISYSLQESSAAQVLAALDNISVLIVFPQASATSEKLGETGSLWQSALPEFTSRGGTLIILDGAGDHQGTHIIATMAGLLSVVRGSDATGDIVDLQAPGDSVASGLPLAYRGEETTVTVSASEFVVAETGSGAVILHRVITPPTD